MAAIHEHYFALNSRTNGGRQIDTDRDLRNLFHRAVSSLMEKKVADSNTSPPINIINKLGGALAIDPDPATSLRHNLRYKVLTREKVSRETASSYQLGQMFSLGAASNGLDGGANWRRKPISGTLAIGAGAKIGSMPCEASASAGGSYTSHHLFHRPLIGHNQGAILVVDHALAAISDGIHVVNLCDLVPDQFGVAAFSAFVVPL
jgi:hypothetical protein